MSSSSIVTGSPQQVRDDAVAAADARVAGAETRLLSRLDEIAAGVAQAVERSAVGQSVVARLDSVEREVSERLREMQAELATVSADAQQLARAQEDLRRALEELAEKVSSGAKSDLRAAGAAERRITEAVDQPMTMTEAGDANRLQVEPVPRDEGGAVDD